MCLSNGKALGVLLVSNREHLIDLCRHTLQSLVRDEFTLHVSTADQLNFAADFRIYDLPSAPITPEALGRLLQPQDVVVVSREQVDSLSETLAGALPSIVLQPVGEGPLRVSLEQSLKRCGFADTDCKTLLQVTLEALVRLQEYDQDRKNFLARGLHDFRAPLTALAGYCGLLLDQQLGPLDLCQAEILSRMRHSVERLSRMAEDMFQLSIRDRCELNLHVDETDLAACVDQAIHDIRPLVDEKEIRLAVDMKETATPVWADGSQIEKVLLNLLDNACKFTPRHGRVDIEGYPLFWERRHVRLSGSAFERRQINYCIPNAYRIDIRDSGPTIPVGQLSTIFEEYASFGGDQDRSGAGLGLAICKLIISRHNGAVWADSSDTGNTFSFVLPFATAESHSTKPPNNSTSENLTGRLSENWSSRGRKRLQRRSDQLGSPAATVLVE